MPKLSELDFRYYRDEIEADIKFHKTKIDEVNSPDEVIAAFNGKFYDRTMSKTSGADMIENYLFVAGATALPSLFYQLPRMQVRSPNRQDLQFSAAILTGVLNATFTDKDKEENQLCIIDAFLPWGFACIKNGYNSRTGKAKNPSLLTGKTEGANQNNLESENEFISYERPIGIRQSPKFTYFDRSQPFGRGNRITFQYMRTLQQLLNSNLYDLDSNFISYYSARNTDKRKIEMTIYESFWMIDGACYKFVYTDGWHDEMYWGKTEYDGIPASLLRFNKMGDVLYNVSHGTLGLNAQKELNYLNELWKKHIDNIRNQHIVNTKKLTEFGRKTIRQNDIGGIIESDQPLSDADIRPVQSASMDGNLFNNIANVREYLKLIMSVTGGKMGGPESDLATVERSKAMGDALRSGGMQDAIRDFMVDQVKKRIKNILRLGSPEMIVTLTGENIINPMTGKIIEQGTMVEIGGDKGLSLQDIVQGDLDIDYIFDVDVTSAARPDYPVIRKQFQEGIVVAQGLEPKLNEVGKKIDWTAVLTDYFSTFDTIPDAKKYIKDMTEEDQQALITKLQMTGAIPGAKPTPNEAAITQGAERVNV